MDLSAKQALGLRMRSLLLAPDSPRCESVEAVVTWFGAMQAQEINSALWSLGTRLPGTTIDGIRAALEDRSVLRTWPMRGTVDFVPACDARWMLGLTGAKALRSAEYRHTQRGLDDETANRAVDGLGGALADRGRMTRAECLDAIEQPASAPTAKWAITFCGTRACAASPASHPTSARARRSRCSTTGRPTGPTSTGRNTRDVGDPLLPQPRPDHREGLRRLARFDVDRGAEGDRCRRRRPRRGRGRRRRDVRRARDRRRPPTAPAMEIWVLPGFDEYMLGFRDRTMMVDDAHMQAIVPGGNGVFQATIVRGGRVVGTWKRKSTSKSKTVLAVTPLASAAARARRAIEAAFEPDATYLARPVELGWPDDQGSTGGLSRWSRVTVARPGHRAYLEPGVKSGGIRQVS